MTQTGEKTDMNSSPSFQSYQDDRNPAEKPQIEKLSILIPVYNEIRTLETILNRVLNAPLPCERELVLVDDCSKDGSIELMEKFAAKHNCIKFIKHKQNSGKGAAIRTAIENMTGDWAIIQDADLEYDPNEYEIMLQPVLDGVADAVFGSRFRMGRYARAMFFWHTLANKILTLLTNVISDLNLTDMETCYKMVRSDILKSLNIYSNGFDLEPELTMKLARWGARIYEVPISYKGRTYAEGKKIGVKDAMIALGAIFKYGFFSGKYCKHDGFMILQAVQKAKIFNNWLFSHFEKYVGDRVIEAGCGIGNITTLLLNKKQLLCLDNEQFYLDRLDDSYGHMANFRLSEMDLSDSEMMKSVIEPDTYDSLICINVLEHIEEDVITLKNFYDNLKSGAHCIILVPHDPKLYTDVDKTLGHFRRYTGEDLSKKMEEAGFEVVHCKGFNRVGGLGWYISGNILQKKTLTTGQMSMFELLMPLIKLAENFNFFSHNSIIAVGKKP